MAVVTRLERKSRSWTQVWQGDSEAVARIVAGRLEAEGVRVRIQGHDTHYHSGAFLMAGTWGILVPAGRAATARELLRENDEGHNVIDEEDEEGLTSSQKATIAFVAILLVTMGLALALAAAFG
ncbi:MAG: hypothetical protein AB7N24_04555 [Dehalococcoidia bacterium]